MTTVFACFAARAANLFIGKIYQAVIQTGSYLNRGSYYFFFQNRHQNWSFRDTSCHMPICNIHFLFPPRESSVYGKPKIIYQRNRTQWSLVIVFKITWHNRQIFIGPVYQSVKNCVLVNRLDNSQFILIEAMQSACSQLSVTYIKECDVIVTHDFIGQSGMWVTRGPMNYTNGRYLWLAVVTYFSLSIIDDCLHFSSCLVFSMWNIVLIEICMFICSWDHIIH